MPRSRKRTSEKAKWSSEQLKAALGAIGSGMNVLTASKTYGIPRSTLRDRIKLADTSEADLGRNPVFNQEQENEIANHILLMAKMFYGINATELRRLAFEYAEKCGIDNPFNKNKRMAGMDWLSGFLRRHSEISVRKPEATSVNRIAAFNREEVELFYRNLQTVMEKYKFASSRIYNMDETGITTVQKPGTILAHKGQKQVGAITSWERGKTVTVICCMNAAGGFVPPLFIYPRKRLSPLLSKDGPEGAVYKVSDNGWTNEDIFFDWIQHFCQFCKPSQEEPILLVLDNHASHTSLRIYEFCKLNNIVMVSLPPHTSHRLQPLDVSFFAPLKSAFNNECDIYMKTNAHAKITPYELASLFNKAYVRVATMQKGISGFRATGIYPLNPHIYTDDDFAAAQIIKPTLISIRLDDSMTASTPDNQVIYSEQESLQTESEHSQYKASESGSPEKQRAIEKQKTPEKQIIHTQEATCSKYIDEWQPKTNKRSNEVRFKDLAPLPAVSSQSQPNKRKKQHSTIMTSTPMKTVLEELQEKRNAQKAKKNKNSEKLPTKKRKSSMVLKPGERVVRKKERKTGKRNLFQLDSSDDSEVDDSKLCDDSESDDFEMLVSQGNLRSGINDKCHICNEFGKNKELWYRCINCGNWVHAECSAAETAIEYRCDFCISK